VDNVQNIQKVCPRKLCKLTSSGSVFNVDKEEAEKDAYLHNRLKHLQFLRPENFDIPAPHAGNETPFTLAANGTSHQFQNAQPLP